MLLGGSIVTTPAASSGRALIASPASPTSNCESRMPSEVSAEALGGCETEQTTIREIVSREKGTACHQALLRCGCCAVPGHLMPAAEHSTYRFDLGKARMQEGGDPLPKVPYHRMLKQNKRVILLRVSCREQRPALSQPLERRPEIEL